jgi:hypothetical protein
VVAAVAEDLAAAARALAAAAAVTRDPARSTPLPADTPVSADTAITDRTSEESSDRPEPADLSGAVAVTGLLDRGLAGVARIPGKHGGQPRNFTVVQVVIADQPGELARLFNAAEAAGVNIEDIRLEHSPGLPVGVVGLSIRPDQAVTLLDAMEAGGWPVRRLRPAGSPDGPSARRLRLARPSVRPPVRPSAGSPAAPSAGSPVRRTRPRFMLGPKLYGHLRHIGHGSSVTRTTSALSLIIGSGAVARNAA